MAASAKPRKQAVVIVHGMGEQRPLATLRSFVEAVWAADRRLAARKRTEKDWPQVPEGQHPRNNPYWIVPDARAGSLELRRITTPLNDNELQTDFFEFYWADIMSGSRLYHLLPWFRSLMLRHPNDVPEVVQSMWCLLWCICLLLLAMLFQSIFLLTEGLATGWVKTTLTYLVGGALGLSVLTAIGCFLASLVARYQRKRGVIALVLLVGVTAAAGYWLWMRFDIASFLNSRTAILSATAVTWALAIMALSWFVLPYFGDVARYTRASPDNVEKRQAVRQRGLCLLRDLHKDRDYSRIVLVGHSLGSVIAYDLLMLWWAERGPSSRNELQPGAIKALREVEGYALEHGAAATRMKEFRGLQRAACERLSEEKDDNWLVSDFITLGSPLTHAEFLVAATPGRFKQLVGDRMISQCPPAKDKPRGGDKAKPTFFYQTAVKDGSIRDVPHHAAVFAAVRWTNLHDPRSYVLFGDFVSGPLQRLFGQGVKDVEVKIVQKGWGPLRRFFTHVSYWTAFERDATDSHIARLREAVDLLDSG